MKRILFLYSLDPLDFCVFFLIEPLRRNNIPAIYQKSNLEMRKPSGADRCATPLPDSLVCPPPPSDSALNEDVISSLIVPAPKWSKCHTVLLKETVS
jgi:hypothetical protein